MLELAAALFILLHSIKALQADIDAVLIAIIGGGIAWVQAKRFQDLSASYRIAASEAADIEKKIQQQMAQPFVGSSTEEAAWATFVDEAEEAFSREHRLWRATRDE